MPDFEQHEITTPTLDPRLVGKGARCPTCRCWITSGENGKMWHRGTASHWTDPERVGLNVPLPTEPHACRGLTCHCACNGCVCHRSDESARQLLLALVT